MADIRCFRALRPPKVLAEQIAALPYDVYNRAEARAFVQDHPLSFLKIDRPETFFPAGYDLYAPEVYQKARQALDEAIAKGQFCRDDREGYYLYALTMDGRTQTGIVACAALDDYLNGVIKKHENTRAEKEADRIHHIDACDMQTGPIFLAYRKNAALAQVIDQVKQEAPCFDFTAEDGIRHQGWNIFDARKMEAIGSAFGQMAHLYIADGHHRAASAVKVGLKRRQQHPGYTGEEAFNSFLCVLFSEEELMILDYNRVVKDLNGLTESEFLEKLGGIFDIQPEMAAVRPSRKGEMGMRLGNTWYRLRVKPQYTRDHPVEGLDVSILQKEVLAPILGITDPRTDSRIDFVGGIRGLRELERRVREDCAVAFSMYPTSIGELFAVADADLLMPPKSTWFEPKLRSGLFLHDIAQR